MEKPKKQEDNPLTKEKMQVYEIIFGMAMKFVLIVAGLVAFFIVLNQVIKADDNITKLGYVALDALLAGSIYLVYRHYFPEKK